MMTSRLQNLLKAFGIVALTGACTNMDAQKGPLEWGQAGPLYTAGRSRNIVVDRTDLTQKTMYAGSASSGIFKTIDAGANWLPVNDSGSVRNISYLAQDINGVIWAATGEGFLRYGQKLKAQRGTGVYKLVGIKLTQVADSNAVGAVINRIACSPTDPSVIALATNKGILISTNSGASFYAPAGIPTNSNVLFGMDLKFASNGNLYCTVGNERGNGSFANVVSKVYISSDNTLQTFQEKVLSDPILADNIHGRIELAIAPSNNNVIYASCANKNLSTPLTNSSDPNSGSMKAVFVSYNAGVDWKLVHQGSPAVDPLSYMGNGGTGDYAHVLVVNPVNPYQVFVGGYRFFVYTRIGNSDNSPNGTWFAVGNPFADNTQIYLHENIHDIKILGTAANPKIYIVTDAGIFRSIDNLLSFQPFYSGFVTGQFNSVSIENAPSSNYDPSMPTGTTVTANRAFIGGTGGNGLTYFTGKYPQVTQETNYVGGEVYNSEFSKILPKAAFFTTGSTGLLYRTSDIRTSDPSIIPINTYTGNLSSLGPNPSAFANTGFNNTTGTPFKLWENYGQVKKTPDSLVFYNDSLRVFASITSTTELVGQSTFSFSAGRPSKFALIDSVVVRTGTVLVELSPVMPIPFIGNDKKDISIKLANTYTTGSGITQPPIVGIVGPASVAGVTLNPAANLDLISVTFTSPPFAVKNVTSSNIPDPSPYYRVYATIFYKYKAGDTITLVDNNISTVVTSTSFPLATPLRWTKASLNTPKPFYGETNPVQKAPTKRSARLAIVYNSKGITDNKYAVLVSKAPLNLNDPLNFVRVSQSGALTTDATGAPVTSTINIPGKPVLLEWSKGGTELYYATDDFKLYRVSNIVTLLDLSQANYSGKLSNEIFKYGNSTNAVTTVINPASPFRTTLLGTFTNAISSISISKFDTSMVLTFNSLTGTRVMSSTGNIRTCDFSNIGFVDKTGTNFPTGVNTYCSLIEKDSTKIVFVGTDNGLYHTKNINTASPTWTTVNETADKMLPNVQVFDIKQQTMARWECYNSGAIYVATYGRGVWTNNSFFDDYVVSVGEQTALKKQNNLNLFPNPTNGNVTLSFTSVDSEVSMFQVFDINGRIVKQENFGKLFAGETNFVFDTADLTTGVYIVNVSGTSGIKRVAKLIVTK